MDGPSASQPQEIPQIFRDEASPWRIFVSANGINGRPKLVRTLKKAGAVICSDPKQASVILVDPTSDAGREFIREWGGDTDKVVLQHTWVAACIAASKVLGKDDKWGGFLTFDDGLPISKEGMESAEDPINPLPTPRITPVEAPPSTSSQSAPNRVSDIPFGSQSSLHNDSLHTYPVNNPFTNQQMYQQSFTMHPAFMSQMQQQAFPQPNSMSVFQPPTGSNGPLAPYPAGLGPWNFDMYNMNMNPLYGTFNRNMMFPPQDPPSISSPPNPTGFNSSTVPPSFRRKSPIISRSTPPSYTSGEQMRSITPTSTPASMPSRSISQSISQQTPSRGPSLSGALFKTKDGRELSFFVQVDLSNRSRTVNAIKKNGGKIVSSNKTADYAILYSQSKTFDQLLESTVLAGTPAVSHGFVEDCVDQNELLSSSSYEFETSNSKSTPRGKRKRVKSEEEDLLDERTVAKGLEKGRSRKDRKNQPSEDEASSLQKTETVTTASPTGQNTRQHSPVESNDPSQSRSPTPPPEYTRIKRGLGDGYMYSEQERDYAQRYIRVLLQRDHRMSNTEIGKALYKKMDNHSLGSWKTFLTQEPFKSVLDGVRKTAGIEFRKQRARTELVAKEVDIVAQFFATGAGRSNPDEDDGNDAVAWERLTQQTKCQSCSSWTDWYSDHHAKVEKRYQELLASS